MRPPSMANRAGLLPMITSTRSAGIPVIRVAASATCVTSAVVCSSECPVRTHPLMINGCAGLPSV